MRLLIVRHAEAGPGSPDELRRLTTLGKEQARGLGRHLRDSGLEPDTVVCSPLLRAVETARELGLAEPVVDERLAPGAGPDDVRAAAEGRGDIVLLIGHQPDCSDVAAALTGGPRPPFPPCGHVLIELSQA